MTANSLSYDNSLKWLLESGDPSIRYLAARDLTKSDRQTLTDLRSKAHSGGPIAEILSHMEKEGYWSRPGAGYDPKYFSTVWSLITLAQTGASIEADKRLAAAVAYLLEHSLSPDGQFSISGTPSGTVDCLQGNLCSALLDIGYGSSLLDKAFDWMARSVTGESVAPQGDKSAPLRYYSGKCGPLFACGGNGKLACAWGAVKVMLAFSKLPPSKRTPLIDRAIKAGIDFLFSRDPAKADYPVWFTGKPSGNWWKFGFPVFYVTDLLQNVEALVNLGCGPDPRLASALQIIREKADDPGRWKLEYDYKGKTWADFGLKGQPNQWVTLRALRVLRAALPDSPMA
jgi:hypothetical protein